MFISCSYITCVSHACGFQLRRIAQIFKGGYRHLVPPRAIHNFAHSHTFPTNTLRLRAIGAIYCIVCFTKVYVLTCSSYKNMRILQHGGRNRSPNHSYTRSRILWQGLKALSCTSRTIQMRTA